MTGLVSALVFMGSALASFKIAPLMIRRSPSQLTIVNYRGNRIPAVGGMVLASVLIGWLAVAMASGVSTGQGERFDRHFWGVAVVAAGLFILGAIDDLGDAGAARGLGGHFRALLGGQVTGGMIKAAGGLLLGFASGLWWEATLAGAVVVALLIALSANLLNLLDLRPGRAGKVFLLLWVPLAAFGPSGAFLTATASVGGALSGWLPFDLKERATLGDSGSNLLGGVVGAGIALHPSMNLKLISLALLAVLNLLSEKVSFSAVIERSGPLVWLDKLGRTPGKST